MLVVAMLFLCVMLVGACVVLRLSYQMFRGRSFRLQNKYNITSAELLASLSKSFAQLYLVLGLWFLILPVLVVLLQVPFRSFAVLIMVGTGILVVGQRIIERKHGLKYS